MSRIDMSRSDILPIKTFDVAVVLGEENMTVDKYFLVMLCLDGKKNFTQSFFYKFQ